MAFATNLINGQLDLGQLRNFGGNPSQEARRRRVSELFLASLDRLQRAIGDMPDAVVVLAFQGPHVPHLKVATQVMVEAVCSFIVGIKPEDCADAAINAYEDAWREALLLAKTHFQDAAARAAARRS
jgi:hypothetical protein